ncbi:MAG: PEP-CTERM sorting domain-containing protein [Edaphobacter sp.]|uniref:PEP-CTERM sorting domain-containing protein n=1 Tax=Edaphobacter sp. TaxID=1934404 RepID=UPI002394B208|nr:PEP-CTERM sorting domain-containing protein [Edaphobacter sp.]MDE1178431.1 PEP-CTERM sorting domain-containing protein [Edaphobacter sp.]
MRITRYLLAISLLCGAFRFAKADDFRMVVLDPPPSSFPTYPIFDSPFTFTFAPCAVGQLPTGTAGTYDGCFSGVNRTGEDWTSLMLNFANNSALSDAAPAVCSLDGGGQDIFAAPGPGNCDLQDDEQYVLIFSGGLLKNNENFVIAEQGVDPSDFPEVTASFTTSAATPEPESLWLLSTGLLYAGSLLKKRRVS